MSSIFLVEDYELNRDMLSRRLRRAGYQVFCAVFDTKSVDFARLLSKIQLHLPAGERPSVGVQ